MLATAFYNLKESHERNACDFINLDRIYLALAMWVDGQLREGSSSPAQLWEIDYFVIDYFYSVEK